MIGGCVFWCWQVPRGARLVQLPGVVVASAGGANDGGGGDGDGWRWNGHRW